MLSPPDAGVEAALVGLKRQSRNVNHPENRAPKVCDQHQTPGYGTSFWVNLRKYFVGDGMADGGV